MSAAVFPSVSCPTWSDRLAFPAATKAFEITTAAAEPKVLSQQGVIIGTQISFKEAYDRLDDFDVLVVLGGNSEAILKDKAEPLALIKTFSDLQMKDISRERTVLSVDTGSLFLAEQGVLSGLAATTHPDYMTAFENLCSHSAVRDGTDRTDVDEEARYVVNNLRFDLGDEDENPYIRRKSDAGRGSVSASGRYVYPYVRFRVQLVLTYTSQKGKHVLQGLVTSRVGGPPRSDAPGWSPSDHEWGFYCWR